jgi:beta-galactosidase
MHKNGWRWLIAAGFLLGLVDGASVWAGEPVARIDLSGEWSFAYTPARRESPPAEVAFKTKMPVPGCWDDQFERGRASALWPDAQFNPASPIVFPIKDAPKDSPGDTSWPYLLGTGWYSRTLNVPTDWKGRQITLHAGRVVMEAWLYVNGRLVHHHLGHSTDWEVSLSRELAAGQANQITIAVDNTRADRVGTVIRGWQGRSGGIFGPVYLRVAGTARIIDLYAYPEQEQLHWRAELGGSLAPDCRLQWRVVDPATGRSVDNGRRPVEVLMLEWSSANKRLEPWSDRHPKTYQLEVELWSGGQLQDVCRQSFGLRRLAAAGTGLQLNGAPIFLRGTCDHVCFPKTCTPPTDVGWYREHIRRLKELGFNWIRCHTWVPPEPYLQAADELGMLFQVEPPTGYALPEWQDIVRACRKHPSVAIYCGGNEELLDDKKIDFLRECAEALRRLAPDALFNPQEALCGVEYGSKAQLGAVVSKPFAHNAARLARLQQFSDVFGQFARGQLSYESVSGQAEQLDCELAIYDKPCLEHELGRSGCFLDLSLERRYAGTRIGPSLYAAARQALDRAGLLARADLYYRNSAAWQRLMFKDAMETARHCRLLAGYDCLGANDSHWHRTGYECGLMNEFDELKPGGSPADLLSYNGESVLLVSRQKERNLKGGDAFERGLSLSWFGEGALRDAVIQWRLRAAEGTVLANGREPVAAVEPGKVLQIASLKALLPKISRPLKAVLEAELTAPKVRLANHWEYWVFPAGSTAASPEVLVVRSLDATALKDLAAGRRVVLFGHASLPNRALSFQMNKAGRIHGPVATVINHHPLTDRFPHDGYCDWQFCPMMNRATAVSFEGFSKAFDPIIEVVSSYKYPCPQAALFEWRVGAGRLLVCSLDLAKDDPAARYLRGQILDYTAGDEFQPRTAITPDTLTRFLGNKR